MVGLELHLVIHGQPVSWKRGKQMALNPKTRKWFLATGKPQARWMKDAIRQLKEQWEAEPIPKAVELNAQIISYLGNRRSIDASNLYQGPEDAMEAAGILEDDACIRRHDGSDRRYDKLHPRVEITLTLA